MKALRAAAPWILATLVLFALAPEAVAGELLRTLPSLWAPAAALGLTLISAAGGGKD